MTRVFKERETKGSERLLLLALADNANDECTCWPSMQTLANKCNLTRRFVIKLLASLEARGYVTSQVRMGADHKYTSNLFTLHPDKFMVNPNTPHSEPQFTTVVNPSSLDSEPQFTGVVNPSSLKSSINPLLTEREEAAVEAIREGEAATETTPPLSPTAAATAISSVFYSLLDQPVDAVFVDLSDPVCNSNWEERFPGDKFAALASDIESLLMFTGIPYIFRSIESEAYEDQGKFFSQHMIVTRQGLEKLRAAFGNNYGSVDHDLLAKCFSHRAWSCFELGEDLCNLDPLLALYQSGRVDDVIAEQASAYRQTKAVKVVQAVTGILPPQKIWPKIYHTLEAEPGYLTNNPYFEIKVLRYCYEIWLERAYKKEALAWLFEWWAFGHIPGISDDQVLANFERLYEERRNEANRYAHQQATKLEAITIDLGPPIEVPELSRSFAYTG